MDPSSNTNRSVSAAPTAGETVRAYLVFGGLVIVFAVIAGQLALRELSVQVLAQRMDAAVQEANRIARVVAALGRDQEGIDFHRLAQKRAALESVAVDRLESLLFVQFIEVRDRFGTLQFRARRDTRRVSAAPSRQASDWPDRVARVITVPLKVAGAPQAGEVRVGVSEDAVQFELEKLRQSLRWKILAAGAAGIGGLVVGFFYVLSLIRKNRRLEASRLAAERRSYVGLLASGLAHEIRNPLNAMNMNLQMLEEEVADGPVGDPDEFRELLDSTKSEIKRLERLVNNFLAYARPAAPRFETRDLNEMLVQTCRFLEADFERAGVTLERQLEPLLPSVELDETQFRQAVMNLLVNARQVMKGGGRIVVRTRPGEGGDVVIEIEDEGPGIPDDVQARIFEVFFSSRGGGTGLGLPIARQIVERHGGTIEVESTVGSGATFRIRLPRRHPGSLGAAERSGAGETRR